ncbi:cutinase-like protein 3 [Elsinoe australis]|uniref:Cutinase n=1 Tax=Elsinoe australis TaxID=40998 RepID=A0A4U7B635_9PEZI|nr:cutinase-like protein 3 [Elsinoe australis]
MKTTLLLSLPLLALSAPTPLDTSLALDAAILEKRATGYSGGSTASDVTNGACAPLTVIFARGTSETGTVGTVVGPPLFSALKSKLNGNVALQGVSYPASAAGNANLGQDGGPTMAKLANQALSQCPGTKVVLSGYSQGAMVVHNAVQKSGFAAGNVAAAVLFGDPLLRQSVGSVPAAKVKEYCASGDGVCQTGTFSISAAHLSYGSDASAAADFIIQTAGVKA